MPVRTNGKVMYLRRSASARAPPGKEVYAPPPLSYSSAGYALTSPTRVHVLYVMSEMMEMGLLRTANVRVDHYA